MPWPPPIGNDKNDLYPQPHSSYTRPRKRGHRRISHKANEKELTSMWQHSCETRSRRLYFLSDDCGVLFLSVGPAPAWLVENKDHTAGLVGEVGAGFGCNMFPLVRVKGKTKCRDSHEPHSPVLDNVSLLSHSLSCLVAERFCFEHLLFTIYIVI